MGIFFLWRNSYLPPAEQPEASVREIPTDESGLKMGTYFDLRGNKEVLISMQNSTFNPQIIIVDKSVRIFWKNEDRISHSVEFDNLPGPPPKTFDVPGFYPYHCDIHPDMKGLIIVK